MLPSIQQNFSPTSVTDIPDFGLNLILTILKYSQGLFLIRTPLLLQYLLNFYFLARFSIFYHYF